MLAEGRWGVLVWVLALSEGLLMLSEGQWPWDLEVPVVVYGTMRLVFY